MPADIIPFSPRSLHPVANPVPTSGPPVDAGHGEIFFPRVDLLSGRHEYCTPFGRAFRLNGYWFVQRSGQLPRAVTADLADDLDLNERRAS